MKAVRIHTYGPPEVLVYEDAPDPVAGAGEIVVEVTAVGVNPADYKFRSGILSAAVPKDMPFVPGMDIAGRIAAIGSEVTGWAVGDRVTAMLFLMGNGAYAERVAVPAEWVARTPDGLDDVTAASLPTPATTAVQWIEDDLRAAPGMRLLVTGATGAVGRIASFVARQCGAHVTAGVRRDQAGKVDYADAVLFLDDDTSIAAGSFDAIADGIGGATAGRLLAALEPGGALSTIATDPVADPGGLDMTVRFFGNHADPARLERLMQAVADGSLTVPAPRTLPLPQAVQAHVLMEGGGAGKIVLVTGK